jgi:hypothetical protein
MTNQNHDPHRSNDPKDTLPPDLSVFLEAIALSFEDFLGFVSIFSSLILKSEVWGGDCGGCECRSFESGRWKMASI